MTFINSDTDREFQFWLRQTTDDHAQSPFVTLRTSEVLSAHFHLIDHFSVEGLLVGGVGPRDMNLLESTVHRQFAGYGDHEMWSRQFDIIATLFYGLVRNHPFHDANKRTALLCMLFHLEKVGKCMVLSDADLENFTVALADRRLDNYRKKAHRGKKLEDAAAEVLFTSRWLRRNSRNVDNDYRDISYQKLQTILRGFGYDLVDPRANRIDLIKYEKKRRGIGRLIGLGQTEEVQTTIRRIGFHSWKSTVPKSVMKAVREAADLTYDRGVDSHVFYDARDPIQYLIGRYETPLRNLAER